ncbi:UDP-3-O-(3-hydroxymyristoyl)glucosamine N-acyltransferase [Parvularcula sp. LCG005]|uniref:UDP-3-O-(3-hydroxymyristoyl)glucosamine N-acyltransferase n=1 Tax=Parvularcula sp. LCG005 TaxID=3078805 RepID=UPI002943ED3F|nr:UDP-3-O-(3-hydroxymyristoyl)glucosamine N-acyltransferase [Parvularcula sp. LCG005]WOI52755.1 UDP-3-O-(3-hydroxymyristoyl)glucosamine N-acyltransferase [Parvularcula sp. LCG005]
MTDQADDAFRPDPRFYLTAPPLSIVDAARIGGATLVREGSDPNVTHASALSRPSEGGLIFAQGVRDLKPEISGQPALVLLTEDAVEIAAALFPQAALATTKRPKAAFASVAAALHTSRFEEIADAAPAADDAVIASTARVADTAVIMAGAQIGEGAVIAPYAVIGPGVVIGRDTHVWPHVSVTHAVIGDHCRIHSGVRIGDAGFGYVPSDQGIMAVPQLGRVLIADNVDIGANTTVDRGALADTIIGQGTKIDNLCQIAHNCRLGQHVLMASQSGISGSTVVGDGVMIGGQTGIAEHLTIGDGAAITGKSGVMKDIPPGERWGGFPAKLAKDWMKDVVALSKLNKKR